MVTDQHEKHNELEINSYNTSTARQGLLPIKMNNYEDNSLYMPRKGISLYWLLFGFNSAKGTIVRLV